MMFYADLLMLGRLQGEEEEAISAMGVAGPISYTIVTILAAVRVGIIATVARAVGEGDEAKQRRAAASGLLAVMGIGVVASAAGLTVLPGLTGLFEIPDNPRVVELAASYVRITAGALFFNLLMIGSAAVMRAAGNTRTPMMIGLAANAINVALNYALIFGRFGLPKMGVVGAAVATAAAQGFYGVCAFALLFTRFGGVRLRPGAFREVTRDSFRSLGRVTGPAVLEPVVMQAGFLTYSIIVAALGQTQLAAHRAGIAVESLVFMPGNAIAIACSALVGQALGARRPEDADRVFHEAARLAVYLLCAIGAGILLFAEPIVRLFVPGNPEVIRLGALCISIGAISEPFFALSFVLGGALRGAGDTKSPVFVAFVGVWLIRVPVTYLLAHVLGFGIAGVWMMMSVDWLVRMVLLWTIYRRGRWKHLKL